MTYGEDDLISPGKYRRRRRSTRHYVLLFNIIYATGRSTHTRTILYYDGDDERYVRVSRPRP